MVFQDICIFRFSPFLPLLQLPFSWKVELTALHNYLHFGDQIISVNKCFSFQKKLNYSSQQVSALLLWQLKEAKIYPSQERVRAEKRVLQGMLASWRSREGLPWTVWGEGPPWARETVWPYVSWFPPHYWEKPMRFLTGWSAATMWTRCWDDPVRQVPGAWPHGELAECWGLVQEGQAVRTDRPRVGDPTRAWEADQIAMSKGTQWTFWVPQPESHLAGKKSSMVGVLREAFGLRWVGHYPFSKYVLMPTLCQGTALGTGDSLV